MKSRSTSLPAGFKEKPTLKRSNAFPFVGEECRNVREGVGLLDIASFSRYEVTGSKAEAWLGWLLAGAMPKPGRARLAPMLSETGKLKGDLTLINWGDGTFWIEGSYYLRSWHMRWFADHAREGAWVRDISDDTIGFAVSGPKARALLERVTHQDVSNNALPFMGATPLDVGLIRTKVARVSVVGELGYEINCRALEAGVLRKTLLHAGADLGVKEYGYNALLSLRLEKSFGIWSAEFTQAYTPRMTGMDRFIAWDKGEFVGRKPALAEREGPPPSQQLVTLEIDATDADASGYEPVWRDGKKVGFVTSGGYGHTTARVLQWRSSRPTLQP